MSHALIPLHQCTQFDVAQVTGRGDIYLNILKQINLSEESKMEKRRYSK